MNAHMRVVSMLALAAALISGCGGDNGTGPGGGTIPSDVMMVYGPSNGPAVDVLINGDRVLTGFDYPDWTSYNAEPSGTASVRINEAGTANLLTQSDFTLPQRRSSTIFVTGTGASLSLLHIQDDLTHPAANQARIRFVNLSPDAGSIDFGFQGAAALVSGQGFRGFSNFQTVAAGSTQIEARAAGGAVLAGYGVNLLSESVYTVILRGMAGGTGAQALTITVIPNK